LVWTGSRTQAADEGGLLGCWAVMRAQGIGTRERAAVGKRVLVAEDDPKTRELLRIYLENAGFLVTGCATGRQALLKAREGEFDLAVLDVLMPEVNGFAVCRALRAESDIPVILLTARSTENDKLHGLGLGADDYVTKPFSPREVVARVKAVLRRRAPAVRGEAGRTLRAGGLVVDPRRHTVALDGQALVVTATEFRLLEAFARFPGRAFTREELAEAVFGQDSDTLDRTIDAHVMKIRKKMSAVEGVFPRIETVFGIGYRLGGDDDAA
jgi:DNA-binding response OmpR family regulator